MAEWHTVESARDEWPDAPVDYEDGGDDILTTLLAVSKEAVLAFAPVVTSTAPAPVELTAGGWIVELSGEEGGLVTATLAVPALEAGSAESVLVPEEFRPLGAPAYVPPGAQAQGRFTNDDNETFLLTANPPGLIDFSMTWQAADTSAWAAIVPDSYRQAQLMQARNVWNASKASPSGDFDGASYGLTSFPLDWMVRQLLRPKRGVPVLG